MTLDSERMLVAVLRIGAVLSLCAFPMALLPSAWMAEIHRRLGLGQLPAAPIVDYLARSISLLYGIHGGLLLLVSTDVHRFIRIVRYLGAMNVVLGAMLLGIDLTAGLPLYWVAAEGPPVALFGVVMLLLARPLRRRPDTRVAAAADGVGNGRRG